MRALLSLSLVAAIGGCSNSVDSLVVVDITADAPLNGVSAFAVTAAVTATSKTSSFRVSPPGGAATFDVDGAGQTFGIDLPKGITGALHVHVDAVDNMDTVLASGDGDTTIKAGSRVDLPLTLMVSTVGNDLGDGSGSDMGPTTGGPVLAIDRTSQTFGNVTVNQSSAAVAVTVTNRGDRQTSAISFTPLGANLDQFALNSDCGAVLMPNQSCHVNATFKPTSAGDKHAHFVVAATMGGMVAADLSGTGTPPGTAHRSAPLRRRTAIAAPRSSARPARQSLPTRSRTSARPRPAHQRCRRAIRRSSLRRAVRRRCSRTTLAPSRCSSRPRIEASRPRPCR